ncbi:MAG TPA: AgmX/PglI C-terminal domain-containing protein [Pseudobdellovibrionaceae bacterium]
MMKGKKIIFSALPLLIAGCASQPASLNKDDVRPVILSHLKEVRICYEATLERTPKSEGKLVVSWQINKEGKATNYTAIKESSTIFDQRLIQCLGDTLSTWQFPIPPDDAVAEITYPFFFRPHSEEQSGPAK